jgi:hypothetical protein
MTEGGRRVHCMRCGSLAQAEDRFCGVCGARIHSDAQNAAPTRDASGQDPSPPSVPTRRGNRTLTLGVIGALLVLSLVGVGAFAALSLDNQRQRSGGVQEQLADDNGNPPSQAGDVGKTQSEEPSGSDEELLRAVGDYYDAAGREDWAYTYDHLDSQTQHMFTEEEWFKKNQWYAANAPGDFEVIHVEEVSAKEFVADVTVRVNFEDGTHLTRDTYFVYEGGSWKHRFGQEELDLFMPDASYEELVQAQQQSSSDDPGSVSSSASAVTGSPSTSGPSTGRDLWAQQAGHHYRVSLSTLTDALRRLDPTHERMSEDYSAMVEDQLTLQAAAQGFRSLDPPPELEEANGYLLEASDSLYNLSYDLTDAYNSFYPSGRLDGVAEEMLPAVEKLDAANRSAREHGVDLDPHSEVPSPPEVRRLFLRLEAKSEGLERREKLPNPKCNEGEFCPI